MIMTTETHWVTMAPPQIKSVPDPAPEKLIGSTISLDQGINALMNMDKFEAKGVTVITEF